MTRSINEWMLEQKVALSSHQAGHIYEGLKLHKCKSFEEQVERVTLYRKWRPKTDKKNQVPTKQVFDLAIAGIDPADVVVRQIKMSAEVLRAIELEKIPTNKTYTRDLDDNWQEVF